MTAACLWPRVISPRCRASFAIVSKRWKAIRIWASGCTRNPNWRQLPYSASFPLARLGWVKAWKSATAISKPSAAPTRRDFERSAQQLGQIVQLALHLCQVEPLTTERTNKEIAVRCTVQNDRGPKRDGRAQAVHRGAPRLVGATAPERSGEIGLQARENHIVGVHAPLNL